MNAQIPVSVRMVTSQVHQSFLSNIEVPCMEQCEEDGWSTVFVQKNDTEGGEEKPYIPENAYFPHCDKFAIF